MIGLGMVLFFVVVAIAGPYLAPMRFQYNDREKNSPPGGRPHVIVNHSANDIVSSGWENAQWIRDADENRRINSATGLCDPCGIYAISWSEGDALYLRGFQFGVYTDYVTYVGIDLQYNSTAGQAGGYPATSVSWDNGTSWSVPQAPPPRYSDYDGAWYHLDFTNATAWTEAKLSDGNFVVRLVHATFSGFPPGGVAIDVVHATVRYDGIYHLLGTTVAGEDVLTGILLGAQISMVIGIEVVVIATLLGSVLGALAGYYGGILDELIMRITDIFLSIPGLILAMAIAAALGRNLQNITYALMLVYWPPYTRLVRAQALSVRENLYVEAARATGASEVRVVTRHVLPNTLAPITVQASLDVGSVVLVAAGLSFLGLGAQPGTPEWGLMVSTGFSFFPNNWWQVTFSGLMIFLFVLGFNLVGDGARDILDPRLRR